MSSLVHAATAALTRLSMRQRACNPTRQHSRNPTHALPQYEWVDWHPRGPILLAGAEDGSAWMWNAEKGVCLGVFAAAAGGGGATPCGAFAGAGGKMVVTGGMDGSLRVWSPKTFQVERTVRVKPGSALTALDVGPCPALPHVPRVLRLTPLLLLFVHSPCIVSLSPSTLAAQRRTAAP